MSTHTPKSVRGKPDGPRTVTGIVSDVAIRTPGARFDLNDAGIATPLATVFNAYAAPAATPDAPRTMSTLLFCVSQWRYVLCRVVCGGGGRCQP